MVDEETHFEIAPYEYSIAQELREQLGISRVLAQVLARRGFRDVENAKSFLSAQISHELEDFGGLIEAATTLVSHLDNGAHITVHGDYDVDGICSTAILIRTLKTIASERSVKTIETEWQDTRDNRERGDGERTTTDRSSTAIDTNVSAISIGTNASVSSSIDWFIPNRVQDGYGVTPQSISRLTQRGTDVLVTVDCGITAVSETEAAKAAGMEVIITDHHQPRADGVLPDAQIVHPIIGEYECIDLCGTGVAYKLAEALYAVAGLDSGLVERELDLVAIATVADMVALQGENRRLVRQGLAALANTQRVGLNALMDVVAIDRDDISASSIGFRIAPRINAAGRLYHANAGLELLLTSDPKRAREIALELDAINSERREIEARVRHEAEALLSGFSDDATPAYVLAGEGWHPGVIGLVASRIVEKRFRPTIIISIDKETKVGTGSGRSIPGFDLLAGLSACGGSLLQFGGHRAAAGLKISEDNLDEFRSQFCSHARATLKPEDLIRKQRVDAIVAGDALTLDLAEEFQQLEPCGIGNPEISLMVPGATLLDTRPLSEGKHLAFTLESAGTQSRGVAFGVDGKTPAKTGDQVDAVARLEVNRFRGSVQPQLILRRARQTKQLEIDLVGESNFLTALKNELSKPLLEGQTASAAQQKTNVKAQTASVQRQPSDFGSRTAANAEPQPNEAESQTQRQPSDVESQTANAQWPRNVVSEGANSIVGLLGDLVGTGRSVLVLCANARYRKSSLEEDIGGFSICSWSSIASMSVPLGEFAHLVALDPPTRADLFAKAQSATLTDAWFHLCWGDSEIEHARKVHRWELELDNHLADLYRQLRSQGPVKEQECKKILEGVGSQPRSGELSGRLLRVLHELNLVELGPLERFVISQNAVRNWSANSRIVEAVDARSPLSFDSSASLEYEKTSGFHSTQPEVLELKELDLKVVSDAERTTLDRSEAFRFYKRQLEEGLQYLNNEIRKGP